MKWVLLLIILTTESIVGQPQIAFLKMAVPAKTPAISLPSLSENQPIPFQIRNQMIVVSATLNGSKGNFILDTGAPRLIINRKPGMQQTQQASSCNTDLTVSLTQIDHFSWAGFEQSGVEAIEMDLSHLEKATGLPLLGMISNEQINSFEILIDYHRQQIFLFPPANNRLHRVTRPEAILSFELMEHLPVIKLETGSCALRFGLDTGAGSNLIDQHKLKTLHPDQWQVLGEEELRGVDLSVRQASQIEFSTLTLESAELPAMIFLTADFSHLSGKAPLKIDGLLGYPFFRDLIFSINYSQQKIYIWRGFLKT